VIETLSDVARQLDVLLLIFAALLIVLASSVAAIEFRIDTVGSGGSGVLLVQLSSDGAWTAVEYTAATAPFEKPMIAMRFGSATPAAMAHWAASSMSSWISRPICRRAFR
jgi:hypothetical protein